jgi:translocation and assembly module TamB
LGRAILLPYLHAGLTDYLAREHQFSLSEVEVDGSLIGGLRLSRIRGTRTDPSAALAELVIDSLRVNYSLLDLFQGLDVFLASTRITIDRGEIVLDLAGSAEDSTAPALPRRLPRIAGRDLSLTLKHGDNALHLAGCEVSTEAVTGQGQPLRLACLSVSPVSVGEKAAPISIALSAWYRPEALVLRKLTFNGEDIPSTGQFLFAKEGEDASFALGLQSFGGELAASGNLGAGRSEFSLRLTELELARIAPLLPPSGYALAGKVSGKAEARINAAGPSGTLDATWQGTINGKPIDLSLQAALEGEVLALNHLVAELAGNRLTLTDAALPLAALADRQRLAADVSVAHFAVSLENIPALWEMAGRSPDAIPLPAAHLLELEGTIREKHLVLTRGRFTSKKNSFTLSSASMQLPDDGQSFVTQPLAGTFRFTFMDLSELAALAALPELAGSLQGSGSISGTLRAPAGRLSVQGKKLHYQGCLLGDLQLEAEADGRKVEIISAQMQQAEDRLHFSGRYALDRQGIENLKGELSIRELGRYGAACNPLGNELSGSLHASLSQLPGTGPQVSLRLRNGRLGKLDYTRADLKLVTDDWRRFEFQEAGLETPQGTLSLAGLVIADFSRQSVTAQMRQLGFSREGTSFVAEKPFTLTITYGASPSLVIDHLALRSPVGFLVASGRLSRREKGSFQLQASGLNSGRWLGDLLAPGYDFKGLEMNLTIDGPLARARGSLVGKVAAFSSPQFGEPFAGVFDLAYSPEGLRLNKFSLSNDLGRQLSLIGSIPYNPLAEKKFLAGPLSLKGLINLPDFEVGAAGLDRQTGVVTGELVAELDLSGTWLKPVGRATIRAKNLTVPQLQGVLPPGPLTLDGALSLQGERLFFQRGRFSSVSWAGEFSGQWFDLPSLPVLLTHLPRQLPGSLAINGAVRTTDLGWLAAKSTALRRVSGRLETTFSLRGKAAQPKLSGEFALENGSLRFTNSSLPALAGLHGKAELVGDTITIHALQGLLGGGPFTVAGTVDLDGENTRFDWTGKGRNLLLFRDADLRIRGDADLRLTGPLSKLTLAGDLVVTDGRYTKKFDFLGLLKGTGRPRGDIGLLQALALPDPPFRDMVLQIKISGGQPFLIRNNLASGSLRPDLRLGGTGELPVLIGRIFVDPSRISLPAGRLAIESGVVTFPENNPDRPTFDLTAKSRMAGYDIDMQIRGTSEEPVITLSSQPSLPDSDLLLLVLTGQPPVTGTGQGRQSVAGMNMAVYLGRGLLADWFGLSGQESDESILERFELDIGRQISSSGQNTVEAQFRLVEGLLLSGDRLFITSERDRYDNYNMGVKIVFRFK